MRFTPTKPVSLRTPNGPKVYQPGDTFEAPEAKAQPYIEQGLIRPVDGQTSGATDSVADFKSKNLAVRIRSAVLGKDVWLCSNETVRDNLKSEGLVCYLAEEIPHLRGLDTDALRAIHEANRVFQKN